jgi:serine/threonine protein kinase/predicted Zn-dependent protease
MADLERTTPPAARRLAQAAAEFPAVGEAFVGFPLIQELGRGAFGRVFLAREPALGARPVVLKVAADLGTESVALAQLQHTNIVPIYAVHRAGPFEALVMPYLGGATFGALLAALRREPALPADGAWLARFQQGHRQVVPGAAPLAPAVDFSGLSYVGAILHLGSRLAEGLGHAHACGILHRDLKPANLLLADTGEPLLLDFNQAQDVKAAGTSARAFLGGTLPYVAPEHLAALANAGPLPDRRADLYSLGLVLYELLTGKYPFSWKGETLHELVESMRASRHGPPPRLRNYNPRITPAEEAIIRHCLEPDPARRYQSAAELLEDLERHRQHLPLKYAPEPSLTERARKWTRRHPRVASSYSVGLIGLFLLGGLGCLYHLRGEELQRTQVAATLQTFFPLADRGRLPLSNPSPKAAELEEGLARERRALDLATALTEEGLPVPEADRARVQATQAEVLLYLSRGERLRAERANGPEQAAALDRAETYHRRSRAADTMATLRLALLTQEAELARLRGDAARAADLLRQAESLPAQSVQDHSLLCVQALEAGRYRDALGHAEAAQRLDPTQAAGWYLLGQCHLLRGAPQRALDCFDVCAKLDPQEAAHQHQRGRALVDAGRPAQAVAAFDQALALQVDYLPARMDRAVAHLQAGHWAAARADLDHCLAAGVPETRLYYLRALTREQQGDAAGARADRAEFLRRTPADEQSWISRGVTRLELDPPDLEGALSDFAAALKVNPNSRDALQNQANVLGELQGRLAEAVAALDRIVALWPEDASNRAARGVLRARLGRRAEAQADAEAAARLDPKPLALYQIGCVYALTARQEPADALPALRFLAKALSAGFGLDLLAADADLAALRARPDFAALQAAAATWQRWLAEAPAEK